MRRSPVIIGVLAAELAIGVLTAAPALADEASDPPLPTEAPPVRDGRQTADPSGPATDTDTPAEEVRTGRAEEPAGDAPADPAAEPSEPTTPETPPEEAGAEEASSAKPPSDNSSAKAAPATTSSTGSPPGSTSSPSTSPVSPSTAPSASRSGGTAPSPSSIRPTGLLSGPGVSPTTVLPERRVEVGDSLWEISARHLAEISGRDRATLSAAEIAAHWVEVCNANRDRLKSGNLSMIYPGEVVVLP